MPQEFKWDEGQVCNRKTKHRNTALSFKLMSHHNQCCIANE